MTPGNRKLDEEENWSISVDEDSDPEASDSDDLIDTDNDDVNGAQSDDELEGETKATKKKRSERVLIR